MGLLPFLGPREVARGAGPLSTPIVTFSPSLRRYGCHRELAVVSTVKELLVQKGANNCIPCFGIETEQALRLGRGDLETGHLEVLRADSAQQFCRCDVRI